jgi:hypothetical protein
MSQTIFKEIAQELLGCEWGRRGVSTVDDQLPCRDRAVQIVVLHDGPFEMAFRFCATHRDRVLAETTPRATEK